jgi:phosphoribosylformylglycinamidine synthase
VSIDEVSVARSATVNQAATLFGESATRVIVSTPSDNVADVLQRAAAARVPARVIGETGGNRLRVAVAGSTAIDIAVVEAERVWSTAIEQVFARKVA